METPDLDTLIAELRRCFPDLQAVYLYGSMARGDAHSASDLDLAVLLPKELPTVRLWEIAQSLASRIGRDVDLLDLRKASTVMQMQVISDGRRLYCSDETLCGQFEDRVFSDYAWLNEERAGILGDIKKRGAVHG